MNKVFIAMCTPALLTAISLGQSSVQAQASDSASSELGGIRQCIRRDSAVTDRSQRRRPGRRGERNQPAFGGRCGQRHSRDARKTGRCTPLEAGGSSDGEDDRKCEVRAGKSCCQKDRRS